MEETSFLSQKFTKPETTQQPNNHRSSSARGASAKHHHPDPPASGQVVFRLLCHVHTAGGVIGNSGSIIKHLETLTESKIRFEEGLPNCHERVINIVGDASVEKKMSVGGGEEEEMADVSKAQEGLIRVFERVLEVEGNSGNNENEDKDDVHRNGFIGCCRLLASKCRIGAVMGKRGKIVDGIRKSSGAKIRVLKEEIPACASPEEELIQIMGGVMAVKKALLAVSHRLQDRTLGEEAQAHMSSHKLPYKLQADLIPNNSPSPPSLLGSAVEHHPVGHSLSGNVERMLNLDENSSMRKVVFRFLCSNAIAGGVIGKSANIVKSLERETGASIKFASPVSGSKERVAIISSLESLDPLYSPARIAVIRVFARSIEVGIDQGLVSSLGNGKNSTARILVGSNQVGCLQDEGGRVASDISIASGVDIQLMGVDLLPKCAGADDDVIQITGEYENVKSALFQVTGKLREIFFSGPGPEGPDRHCSSPAIPSSSPNCREAASSTRLSQLSRFPYIDQLDHLGFVQKSSSPDSPVLQWDQAVNRGSTTIPVDSAQGSTTFTCELKPESNVGNDVPKQTVEVVVPREVFGSVYGENGSNVARLKEISGASVILQDPCPGESNGKVIIFGTRERILIAQSLLQAFISF